MLRIAGIASMSGNNCVTSWRFAPVKLIESGTPFASVATWCLEPGRARYTGWPVFVPAPIARTEGESTTTRDKSIWPAARNLPSSTSCNRSHTPASCQSRKRRQQVTPEPQPISAGRSRQRSAVCNTNAMPFNAARSGTGLRPGYFSRRAFAWDSNGSSRRHNSSAIIGLFIPWSRHHDGLG